MSVPSTIAASDSSIADLVRSLAQEAKDSSQSLQAVDTTRMNALLMHIAASLRDSHDLLLQENQKDLEKARQRGLSDAMIDRLKLDESRIEAMASGIETVAKLDDPVGRVLWRNERPNGLLIERVAVPIGVLGMIYESRPNVTIDASALSLKSRNAIVLRGGSESLHSSLALHVIIQNALEAFDLPKACVQMIPVTDREAVGAMLTCADTIDVMIPRGGKGLTSRVMAEAQMPVFGHLEGLCHIYVHPSVKPELAHDVIINAKLRRTGICGSVETLLMDQAVPAALTKEIVTALLDKGCEVRGDDTIQTIDSRITPASEEDWRTEYLAPIVSILHIDGLDQAIAHINHYGTHHTDCILAEDEDAAQTFLSRVDSGIVMHNASTQFADGGEFGMGAEIGIATGKMHARGPVGLEQLCTYKYFVKGTGQTRP